MKPVRGSAERRDGRQRAESRGSSVQRFRLRLDMNRIAVNLIGFRHPNRRGIDERQPASCGFVRARRIGGVQQRRDEYPRARLGELEMPMFDAVDFEEFNGATRCDHIRRFRLADKKQARRLSHLVIAEECFSAR